MEKPPFDIAALAEIGDFQVTLEGEIQESFFTHKPCVYFEWTYGVKELDSWTMTWQGYRSHNLVTALTAYGPFTLRVYQIRLYIAPSYSRVYSAKDAEKAPEAVRKKILQENRPLTVEEYRLEANKPYHAQIEVDSYAIPPMPGESTLPVGRNAILAISDLPFVRGRPQRPMTPSCLNLTY